MNKDQAKELLIKEGYCADVIDGVVLVQYKDENTYKEITKILKNAGYNSSYGTTSKVIASTGVVMDEQNTANVSESPVSIEKTA